MADHEAIGSAGGTDAVAIDTTTAPRSSTLKAVLIVLGVAGLLAITRLPSTGFYPLNANEAVHAASAVRCSQTGQLPYVGAVGNGGPLQDWLYQLIFWFAGDYNIPAVHWVGALVVALNTAMVWHITSRCFGRYAGPSGAALYLLAMGSRWEYLSFSCDMPASLLLMTGAWLVLTARRPLGPIGCLLAGLLTTGAAGFRQNCLVAYPAVVLGVGLLSWAYDRRLWPVVGRAVLVALGGMLPVAAVLGVYAQHDALGELAAGYFGFNTMYYVKAMPRTAVWVILSLRQFSEWLDDAALVTLLALMGLVPALWRVGVSSGPPEHMPNAHTPRPQGRYLAILTVALFASTCIGLRFDRHYRMLDWPFAAALAAGGWVLLLGELRERYVRLTFRLAGTLVLAALGLCGDHAIYIPGPWAIVTGPIDAAPYVAQTAFRLRANTTAQDSLFVWGSQPQIYLLAQRRMATRFADCTPQAGLIQIENSFPLDQDRSAWVWPDSFEQMMADLRADPPAYVIDASQDISFALGRYPIDEFPVLAEWLKANYVYDFQQGDQAEGVMVVYRRRDRAPTDLSRPVPYRTPGRPTSPEWKR